MDEKLHQFKNVNNLYRNYIAAKNTDKLKKLTNQFYIGSNG